jgi:hypothetical protein
MSNTSKPLNRAIAALNLLLTQVSAITLKDISPGRAVAGGEFAAREIDIFARIEVFGRNHTLACQVSSGCEEQNVRTDLEQLRSQIADMPGKITPVLIVPVLSPKVQNLCEENGAGCVDLRGNGRLVIDEVFVSMRSLPHRVLHQPAFSSWASSRCSAAAQPAAEATQNVLRGFPPAVPAEQHRIVYSSRQSGTR